MSRKLLVLNAATLSPAALASHAPGLHRLARAGSLRALRAPFPRVTCASHATMLTGTLPREHGIVGNGWYERAYAKLFMWNRSSHLMRGETLWQAAKRRDPKLRCANMFWRHCADSNCDTVITERPVYWSSGRKSFDFYASPSELHRELVAQLGEFPFFHFWGPLAGIKSTRWILQAALHVMRTQAPELMLVYAPYLDYDAERHGAQSPEALAAVRRFDAEVAPLLEAARAEDRDIVLVSDYGWSTVDRPVYINRALREAGLLCVERAANGERLEPGTSRAFALCDNQVAQVYVADPNDRAHVRALLEALPGVAEVLDSAGKVKAGIDHERAGDLIAVADHRSWFAYPYWRDERAAPDFRHCIAIFDKIGCDPTELFPRPGLLGKLRIGMRKVQKELRLAVPVDICSGDERLVGGSRNARDDDPQQGAVLLTSWPLAQPGAIAMENLKELLLGRIFEAHAEAAAPEPRRARLA